MSNRLIITELDFDTILANLKEYLRSQSEFSDYDFEGSGLSVLLRILAYNTHYGAYYNNMVANESFLDTAQLRSSVVSHAKALGYIPYSKQAPRAIINLQVSSLTTTPGKLTLPRGYSLLSNLIDGKSYRFVVTEPQIISKVNGQYTFENVKIYEGQIANYQFIQDDQENPTQIFTIPDDSIDTSTLKVTVSPSTTNTSIEYYTQVSDIINSDGTSLVYFLQEGLDGNFQIYFGDDVIGKKVPDGGVVNVSYVVTNGLSANKANNFIGTSTLIDTLGESLSTFTVIPISAASGGSNKETVDEIKYAAPLSYASQNRLVTYKDYEVFVKNNLGYVDSVSVWGGEDEEPPVFGKVFMSLKTKDNYYISEAEKTSIIEDLVNPKAVVNIRTEIVDPDYIYLEVNVSVTYDPSKTLLTYEQMVSQIQAAIDLYNSTYLNKFESRFVLSKLEEDINNVNTASIIGSDVVVKVQKRFAPSFGSVANYTLDFGVPLKQGVYSSKLTTSEFATYDAGGVLRNAVFEEVPNSFTGVSSVNITDPGTKYTSTPTVTITGDGNGATAEAVVSGGKIQSINITNPGLDYSYAKVVLTGGGGHGFSGDAIIDNRIGIIRVVYYNSNGERQIIKKNVGQIYYDNGYININDLNIVSTETSDGLIKVSCPVSGSIISSARNSILNIDDTDPYAITITLNEM